MKKIERVYREILFQAFEKENRELTQKFLSNKCEVSIGNVNYALKPLENMNTIEKKAKKFLIIDPKKILIYWASIRNLSKDVIYETHSDKPLREIENEMPPCLFTAYSGYKFKWGEPPADYSEIYVYTDEEEVKRRFPPQKGKANIFVLKRDDHLTKFKETPVAQIYVDLWNLPSWYAREFIKSMEEKIDGILER
ncbi:hypothetical protein AKJ52_02955 [candidate division MSBL1 archaeon SCGC-AAA382C18]|uniref:Winged helix-turn-helix domain-containing protein n=1 Tax=candidate division MSBL1 archaeon SCGC-AAA382C18 TaxID=1698281 RepID=A0A133VHD8_9EURY|nr:hypothetical protein AKJ52_02955 [candidate division MSBL1 archaeon SCGC-AAA382C18]